MSSPMFFLLLLLTVFFIILFNHFISIFLNRRSLPPGPTPWPLVGNLLQLENKLHISMANFAKTYGPLFSLRLGTQLVIVASSPAAAAEILKTHDRLLSARLLRKAIPYRSDELDHIALIWNPNASDHWKLLRSLSRTELFSSKAIESQAKLREAKLKEMIEYLNAKQGRVVNIAEVVFATVFNTLSNLLFSKDLIGLEYEGKATGLKSTMWKMLEAAGSPNIADFYPILGALDPQGLKKKMSNFMKEMFGVWEIYIKERREKRSNNGGGGGITDFLDVFLANGFDDDQINWLFVEFFTAGTDTTTTTVEWAMTEILKNERVLKTLVKELDRELNNETIDKFKVSQLPYLNACIKETLRLHPPAPFLLHKASETCEIMSYTIPKDVQIFVNVCAIGKDPSTWGNPLSFKPERFLETDVNFKGQDFGFIPFGSGRRICPGLPMATRQLQLILGYLIHCFDWSLPNNENPACLDATDKFGITLQKDSPLLVIPKTKFC